MEKVLIDSDALFAVYKVKDLHHINSIKMYKRLRQSKTPLYITNLVAYETATLLSYRISQQQAVQFLNDIFKTDFNHIFITEQLAQKTLALFLVQIKKRSSFVDCANAIVMKEFNIEKIFSFDEFYKDKRLRR